jgi:hypothetical protein
LSADQLHDPHAAVYAALLLADAGELDAAKDYAAAASDNEIYPEEKKVLNEAKAKIASAAATPSPAVSPIPTRPSPTPASTPGPLL